MTNAKLATMSIEDLISLNSTVVRMIKAKRSQANASAVYSFNAGDEVKFTGKRGTVYGKVMEVKRTKISVNCGVDGRWLVAASMLTKVDAK